MGVNDSVECLKSINGNCDPLFFILGLNSIENEKHTLKTAEFLKKLSEKLKFSLIFKSSFDKANRTSLDGYRSCGLKEGKRILQKVRDEFDVPITTDIHECWQAEEVASFADIIQIPAFLCRQTDLLLASGKTGKIINIKKGQFAQACVMEKSAQKVVSTGNNNVWLCERGFTFGYGNLIVDFCSFPLMKQYGYPIVFDATHSVQQPNTMGAGVATGGAREHVGALSISAVAQGIAGLFMEVHEEPERALVDGPSTIRLSQLENFLRYLINLDSWIKSKEQPVIT
jgi:2-dehydro-3-deoxyphosphooctonate aldolase (KDO 8-P synthase)